MRDLLRNVIEAGSRTRTQPPPPHVVFEALIDPDRDPRRPWLLLLEDEQRPRVLRTQPARLVVWSSLWPSRPDAEVHFHLEPVDAETSMRWTLLVDEPFPDDSKLGHLRKRLNQLINGNLRRSFGQ
jgi:hypothetical protein